MNKTKTIGIVGGWLFLLSVLVYALLSLATQIKTREAEKLAKQKHDDAIAILESMRIFTPCQRVGGLTFFPRENAIIFENITTNAENDKCLKDNAKSISDENIINARVDEIEKNYQ